MNVFLLFSHFRQSPENKGFPKVSQGITGVYILEMVSVVFGYFWLSGIILGPQRARKNLVGDVRHGGGNLSLHPKYILTKLFIF